MNKKLILILLFNIFLVSLTGIEIDSLSISLLPGGVLPLGDSTSCFTAGGGVGVSADLRLTSFPLFFFKLDTTYSYIPIRTNNSVSVYSASAGGGVTFNISGKLNLAAYGTGGYFYSAVTDGSGEGGGNIALKGGLSLSLAISPALSILADAHYLYNFYLNQSLGLSIGASYTLPLTRRERPIDTLPSRPETLDETTIKRTGKGLEISSIELDRIFPVLFKHYDDNPVGRVLLYNNESSSVTDIVLTLFVERYMDNPKECPVPYMVNSKEEIEVDLFALFSDSVLEITEGTKVSAKLTLGYTLKGKQKEVEYTQSIELYDRNATTWDDDRKAAAFVTAKDPAVLEFSKRVAGWTQDSVSRAVNKNLCMAMGLHEALRLYGLSYVVDPKTPFTEFSKDKLSVDFLQFPRQTLTYTAGDCDDLSILYSALLESVGIETAFVTIPGHIFMAFSLDMEPNTARNSFLRPDDLIYSDGKTWLPVEITMVKENFLSAWETGAKEWRENAASDQAKLFPMHNSWNEYKPVGLPGTSSVSMPDRLAVVNSFKTELVRFIDGEIYPQVSKLQVEIKQNNNAAKYVNRLGVLYGRYGLTDKAVVQFEMIINNTEYLPALINMGNISFLKKDIKEALEYYQRASAKDPDNPKVLLSVARCSHELENYGLVRNSYDKLKLIDPDLAEQFAYLALRGEEASRAAEINEVMEVVVWDEE
jgi:tetratricopeptide (TPR) repeat protein